MNEHEQRLNIAINTIARGQVEMMDKLESLVIDAVKKTVNGKVDKINEQLAQHIRQHAEDTEKSDMILSDVKPIIEEYKFQAKEKERIGVLGDRIIKTSKVIGGITVILSTMIYIFTHISYK